MCIKGPKSWWITKSITPQLVVNQSKVNPQRPEGGVIKGITPLLYFLNYVCLLRYLAQSQILVISL